MPAVRKVMPLSDSAYLEVVVFGDVEARDRFFVETWHRTARVENGKIAQVTYGHSYPAFSPRRRDPEPEAFYRALFVFAEIRSGNCMIPPKSHFLTTGQEKQFDIKAQYD